MPEVSHGDYVDEPNSTWQAWILLVGAPLFLSVICALITFSCAAAINLHVYLGFSDMSRWDNTGLGTVCLCGIPGAFVIYGSIAHRVLSPTGSTPVKKRKRKLEE